MEQINVISPIYKNTSVNFDGFIIDFNFEGKGVLNFESNQTEKIEEIFKMHSGIFKGDELPVQEQKINSSKEENINEINVEIEQLKESNKKLALENAELKKKNEILQKEKETLEDKICSLMQENKIQKGSEEKKEEEKEQNEEEIEIKNELNKKTIPQLKEILNSEDFINFKEEWKNLTKKEDIIDYILKKVEK